MIPPEAIVIRKYDPTSDEAFIFSTWLRNYKHSSYFAKRVKPSVFFAGHHKIVSHLLAKPTTTTFIAHPKDDPNTMLGYLVCDTSLERPIVHFTFVKEAFRKMGILRTLMSAAKITAENMSFTHWTIPVDDLIRKFPDIIYNPYAL